MWVSVSFLENSPLYGPIRVRTRRRGSVRARNAGKCQFLDNSPPRRSVRVRVRTPRCGSVRVRTPSCETARSRV